LALKQNLGSRIKGESFCRQLIRPAMSSKVSNVFSVECDPELTKITLNFPLAEQQTITMTILSFHLVSLFKNELYCLKKVFRSTAELIRGAEIFPYTTCPTPA
jgi:hypothetical protein